MHAGIQDNNKGHNNNNNYTAAAVLLLYCVLMYRQWAESPSHHTTGLIKALTPSFFLTVPRRNQHVYMCLGLLPYSPSPHLPLSISFPRVMRRIVDRLDKLALGYCIKLLLLRCTLLGTAASSCSSSQQQYSIQQYAALLLLLLLYIICMKYHIQPHFDSFLFDPFSSCSSYVVTGLVSLYILLLTGVYCCCTDLLNCGGHRTLPYPQIMRETWSHLQTSILDLSRNAERDLGFVFDLHCVSREWYALQAAVIQMYMHTSLTYDSSTIYEYSSIQILYGLLWYSTSSLVSYFWN